MDVIGAVFFKSVAFHYYVCICVICDSDSETPKLLIDVVGRVVHVELLSEVMRILHR